MTHRHNKLTLFLRNFFKFTYYFGITPFKIGSNENGDPVIKSWLPQKIISAILTVISITPHVTHGLWFTTRKKRDWLPPLYFRFLTLMFRFAWYLFAYLNFWFYPVKFVNIVKFIEESKALPQTSLSTRYLSIFSWVCIVIYGIGGILEVFGMLNNFDITIPNQYLDFQNSSLFLLIIQLPIFFHSTIAGFLLQLVQLFCVLTLWLPSHAFAKILHRKNMLSVVTGAGIDKQIFYEKVKHLSKEKHPQWERIREQYFALKELSSLLNGVVSEMMFFYTTFALSNYSYLLDSVFLTKMETDRLRLFIRYMNVGATFILAADVCKQVEKLKYFMASDALKGKVISKARNHRIGIIFHEVCRDPSVAFRGWKAFTVTYTLVAHMSGAIMTYFIICVQFR